MYILRFYGEDVFYGLKLIRYLCEDNTKEDIGEFFSFSYYYPVITQF